MTDEKLWKSCGNCKHQGCPNDDGLEACIWWEKMPCPDCGGILSTVREHGHKKVRHCYACHFEFEVK